MSIRRILAGFALSAMLTRNLLGLGVKVTSIDQNARRITVLLPLHHTSMQATLVSGEEDVRVRINEFYDAEIESGTVGTTKHNVLLIKIPKQKPVRFRLRSIAFLD